MAALSGRQGFFAVLFVCLGIVGLTAFLTLRSPSGEPEPEPSAKSVSESLERIARFGGYARACEGVAYGFAIAYRSADRRRFT